MSQHEQESILSMLRSMEQHLEGRQKRQSLTIPYTKTPKVIRRKKRVVAAAERFPFEAKVVMQRSDRYLKARAVNISQSGMLVQAGRQDFRIDEKVRLYIRPSGHSRSYQVIATVVRLSGGVQQDGYGLKFVRVQR